MIVTSPLASFRAVATPAAGSKATVSVAALATSTMPSGQVVTPYIVVSDVTASMASGTGVQTPIQVSLIDGTTGGTNVQLAAVGAVAAGGAQTVLAKGGLMIPITSGTVTLEFAAAPVAGVTQAVSVMGYHVGYGGIANVG